ncbi:hypothetical protein AX17_006753 [Amanita inopinata Kibby_2008]|nr:hypothetical protein AX17_006753 [Amanita inopinata Kibby_2008]
MALSTTTTATTTTVVDALHLDTSPSPTPTPSSPSPTRLLRERSLRRAGNILKSNGQPVLAHLANQRHPNPPRPPLPSASLSAPATTTITTTTTTTPTSIGARVRKNRGLSVSVAIFRRIQEASKNLGRSRTWSSSAKSKTQTDANTNANVNPSPNPNARAAPDADRRRRDAERDAAPGQQKRHLHPHTRSHSASEANVNGNGNVERGGADTCVQTATTWVTASSLQVQPEQLDMSSFSELATISEHVQQQPQQQRDGQTRNGTSHTITASASAREALADVHVPPSLQEGTLMIKVTNRKRTKVVVRLDPDMGQIIWETTQPLLRQRIIPIENIKEMRSGLDARYYREQFQLSQVYEDMWLTIIYIRDGNYKTLHLIAPSVQVFRMWDTTLRKLYAIRQELMSGLGNYEMRQAIWEKQYWKGSDLEDNEKLRFEQVEKLCKRMNIHSSSESLMRLFQQADVQNHGYLDFDDFRRFVKLLKGRPEVDRRFRRLVSKNRNGSGNGNGNVLDFRTFEVFMREKQRSKLSSAELRQVFDKYAKPPADGEPGPGVMTLEGFTSFLMSQDNSAFLDQHGKVWHDMTRPLSDYFISSSHNTYLVGHQLVGVSTIEGYIRALLHGCRSVELDIYDGDVEPMIFHGKTLTSKVSLREVCHAIHKYGFVASPYPIIISAEVHCSLPQQDMIADIMIEVLGDALVRTPTFGARQRVAVLPSPEELKEKILFKTKDLTVVRQDSGDSDVFTETSGTSSASDSEALLGVEVGEGEPRRRLSAGGVGVGIAGRVGAATGPGSSGSIVSPLPVSSKSPLTPPMQAAKTVIQKVRHVGKSVPSKTSTPVSVGSNGSGQSVLGSPVPLSQSPRSEPSLFESMANAAMATSPTSSASASPPIASPPRLAPTPTPTSKPSSKPKISPALQSLLVYTVGVKFQGINKKVDYAPEHMFSLSETTANKMIKAGDGAGMHDLIKHCRTHLVRIYPKGLRVSSTNYEPHRYWSAGAQLVAMNWQTFDLGYMINQAMFRRNGRSGYVLKPAALRLGPGHKELLGKRTSHYLNLTIISAQQLPRPKDSLGREMVERPVLDPYVEVTVHVPDWMYSHPGGGGAGVGAGVDKGVWEAGLGASGVSGLSGVSGSPGSHGSTTTLGALSARSITYRTSVVKNNGFNPVWEETIRIPFECVGDMWDLVFVRFVVRQEDREDEDALAVYCVSLGSLAHGYRHLPLHDAQLSQYLFSTLFVRVGIDDVEP